MTKIKICGLTNADDARRAVYLGADAIGFVFAASPRRIRPQAAREIALELPPFVHKVGVFVDDDADTVKEILDYCCLDVAQFHGERCRQYLPSFLRPFIKAFAVRDITVLEQIRSYGLPHFMLDASHNHLHGGTGITFDWQIAREASALGKVILSGGLRPDNVREALTQARPYAVDVCSGIEKSPGIKDHDKMQRFIEEVRNWDSQMH